MTTEKHHADLGDVQQTLFIPLAARAHETQAKHPVLRDPRAVELVESIDFDTEKYGRGSGGVILVLRTAIFDHWVREWLAANPTGTVVELGTGLNTRFERVDNGQVHWFDLDLPDTIELRRRFFTDTDRRRMIAASLTDETWLDTIMASPGPYFFVSEGVLVYLTESDVLATLTRIATRFPGATISFDTYATQTHRQQARLGARKGMAARWQWPCDDPCTLETVGMRMLASVPLTRPPKALRGSLPARGRALLTIADPFVRKAFRLNLYEALGRSSGRPSKE
jgi:O-methyltransferase involved in polyketide biosynthesis